MRNIILVAVFSMLMSVAFEQSIDYINKDAVVATGKTPQTAIDKKNNVHIVYGMGDSIMYVSSINNGKSFTSPALIAVLPGLFASAMRGPQVAATDDGLIVTACTNKGNNYSYKKQGVGKWTRAIKVSDVDEVAKEALMGLSADGLQVFAVWLAVKNPKGQNVYGAKSVDGGKTWRKNVLVYDSPDKTVCECCKPAVALKGNNVYVMFRNWLNGNRDLNVAKSSNRGQSFKGGSKVRYRQLET